MKEEGRREYLEQGFTVVVLICSLKKEQENVVL